MKQFLILIAALIALQGALAEDQLDLAKDGGRKCRTMLTTIWPDPENCENYYLCILKKATLHTCPLHTRFSALTRTCLLPSFVNCGDRPIPGHDSTTVVPTTSTEAPITTVVPTTSTEAPTTTVVPTTSTEAPTTTEEPTTTPAPPTCYAGNDGFFPNLVECSKYYFCSNGMRFDLSCPNGTVFNPETLACDLPENVPSCQ